MEVRQYRTAEGKTPVADWLEGLRDGATCARITGRLDRLKAGLLGDWKSVGGGICELRIDMEKAHAYWKDYKARLPKPPVQRGGTFAK